MLILGDNNKIVIGCGVHIDASPSQPTVKNACYGAKICIGDNCLLSNNIEIHSTYYHNIYDKNENLINKFADIVLGNHVWVGLGVK